MSLFLSLPFTISLGWFFQGQSVRRELLLRYFGQGSVQGTTPCAFNSSDPSTSSSSSSTFSECLFDPDLKPLREISLFEIQCKLCDAKAVDLVIDLIVLDPSYDIFLKTVQLAKAMLHGGNEQVKGDPLDNLTNLILM